MDTIFSKIIRGEIPATKIYEDNEALAFLDINPVSKGHTLLIPKEPHVWMQDVPDELLANLFVKAKKLMIAIKKGLECDYVQISVVGKDVPHFHIHLIPRFFDDGLPNFPTVAYEENEMHTLALQITNALE